MAAAHEQQQRKHRQLDQGGSATKQLSSNAATKLSHQRPRNQSKFDSKK
jgi:hypothetical protein